MVLLKLALKRLASAVSIEHAREIRNMADIRRLSACYADPSIFDCTMQQSINPLNTPTVRQSAKSINVLYQEQGIDLFGPFSLDRSDVGFAGPATAMARIPR